jgi:hypothetical protein
MHDVSVLPAELIVAPGESTAEDNVQQMKDLTRSTSHGSETRIKSIWCRILFYTELLY